MKYSKLQEIIEKIVSYSEENSSGMIMNRIGIANVISILEDKDEISMDEILNVMGENESDNGFLVKESDFLSVMNFKLKT